jgi:hypothetical protein
MIRWKFTTEPIEFISDSLEQLERHKLYMAKKLKITNLEITILNDNNTPTKPLSSFSNTAGFAQSTVSVDSENVQHEQTSAQLLNVHGDVVGTVGSLTNFSDGSGNSSDSSSGDSHTN